MHFDLTPHDVLDYPLGEDPTPMPLEDLLTRDTRIVFFSRTPKGDAVIELFNDGHNEPLRQTLVRHSPTGLEFGYGGSGPADTALNILALVLTPREANRLHQRFKFAHIANLPRAGGRIALHDVRDWIAAEYQRATEKAASSS